MTVQPLTPAGVALKIAEVYALSTPDRLAEATAIETSFTTWVSDNFSLSGAQSTYMSGMNSDALKNYGYNCGLCFRSMLSISLRSPTPPPGTTKWIKLTNNLLVATNAAGTLELTGTLTFEMEYR